MKTNALIVAFTVSPRRATFSNCIDLQHCDAARKADPYVCCCEGDLCNDKYCVNSAAGSLVRASVAPYLVAIFILVYNKLAT